MIGGVGFVQLQSLPQIRQSRLVLLLDAHERTQIVQRVGVVRIGPDGFLKALSRRAVILQRELDDSQLVRELGIRAADPKSPLIISNGRLIVAARTGDVALLLGGRCRLKADSLG